MGFREGWSNGGAWDITTISGSWGEVITGSSGKVIYDKLLSWSFVNMPQMSQYMSSQKTQTYFRNNNGFLEGNNNANIYSGAWHSKDTFPSTLNYTSHNITLDGSGVDIILCDLGSPQNPTVGINENHGEMLKPDGTLKLNAVNWNEVLGADSDFTGYNNQSDYYRPRTSHARTCAISAVGNTMGSAPGAELYFIKANVSITPFFSGGGLGNAMKMAQRFHESKSIDSDTGYKRPTIFCLVLTLLQTTLAAYDFSGSDEYNGQPISTARTNITTHSFGGVITTYSGSNVTPGYPPDEPNLGITSQFRGMFDSILPYRDETLDTAADEMCNAGVIFAKGAGNTRYQPVYQTGSEDDPDWDPLWENPHHDDHIIFSKDTTLGKLIPSWNTLHPNYNDPFPSGSKVYYNRGSSPTSNKAIMVGGITPTISYTGTASAGNYPFSIEFLRGPRIDVFGSTQGYRDAYYLTPDNEVRQGTWTSSFLPTEYTNSFEFGGRGTSFSTPFVAGTIALYLQTHPWATSKDVKDWFKRHSSDLGGYQSADLFGEAAQRGLLILARNPDSDGVPTFGGRKNRALYNPFNSRFPYQTTGSLNVSGGLQLKL